MNLLSLVAERARYQDLFNLSVALARATFQNPGGEFEQKLICGLKL